MNSKVFPYIVFVYIQVFGSKVRVDSTQKIAELEVAEKVSNQSDGVSCDMSCDPI